MKVVDWVNCYTEAEKYEDLTDEEFDDAWVVVMKEMKDNDYHFNGSYHQYGDYGMPLLDNGKAFFVSQRTWGRLMAETYPEEFEDPEDPMNYVEWYIGPEDLSKQKLPKGDK